MSKWSSNVVIAVLALCGIVATILPWSGFRRGSLPPGNLPDSIFYGYQVNGKYAAACFIGILVICLLTSLRKPIAKNIVLANALLALGALLVALVDIVKIAFQGSMTGVVPYLLEGPYVTFLVAVIVLVLSIRSSLKNS